MLGFIDIREFEEIREYVIFCLVFDMFILEWSKSYRDL